jgi:hypothetical protein
MLLSPTDTHHPAMLETKEYTLSFHGHSADPILFILTDNALPPSYSNQALQMALNRNYQLIIAQARSSASPSTLKQQCELHYILQELPVKPALLVFGSQTEQALMYTKNGSAHLITALILQSRTRSLISQKVINSSLIPTMEIQAHCDTQQCANNLWRNVMNDTLNFLDQRLALGLPT